MFTILFMFTYADNICTFHSEITVKHTYTHTHTQTQVIHSIYSTKMSSSFSLSIKKKTTNVCSFQKEMDFKIPSYCAVIGSLRLRLASASVEFKKVWNIVIPAVSCPLGLLYFIPIPDPQTQTQTQRAADRTITSFFYWDKRLITYTRFWKLLEIDYISI